MQTEMMEIKAGDNLYSVPKKFGLCYNMYDHAGSYITEKVSAIVSNLVEKNYRQILHLLELSQIMQDDLTHAEENYLNDFKLNDAVSYEIRESKKSIDSLIEILERILPSLKENFLIN